MEFKRKFRTATVKIYTWIGLIIQFIISTSFLQRASFESTLINLFIKEVYYLIHFKATFKTFKT